MSDDTSDRDDEAAEGTDDEFVSATDDHAADAAPDEDAEATSSDESLAEADSADSMFPQMKLCEFCLSQIDALASRCNRCGGFLPPAEGTDFKQHWTLLFTCLSVFVACIWLPIEGARNDLYASHSISGGFLTIFAAYGVVAMWVNIFAKKQPMIMWPALFMALDGLYVGIRRLLQLLDAMPESPTKEEWIRIGGPGLWVILFCSLLVFWTLLRGAAAGRKKDIERKEAARAARSSSRR
jgi:hypothetical protein